MLHYSCSEHLGSKLNLNTIRGMSKLPLKNILVRSSAFKYSDHSIDQVGKLILQCSLLNSAENIGYINYIFCLTLALRQCSSFYHYYVGFERNVLVENVDG